MNQAKDASAANVAAFFEKQHERLLALKNRIQSLSDGIYLNGRKVPGGIPYRFDMEENLKSRILELDKFIDNALRCADVLMQSPDDKPLYLLPNLAESVLLAQEQWHQLELDALQEFVQCGVDAKVSQGNVTAQNTAKRFQDRRIGPIGTLVYSICQEITNSGGKCNLKSVMLSLAYACEQSTIMQHQDEGDIATNSSITRIDAETVETLAEQSGVYLHENTSNESANPRKWSISYRPSESEAATSFISKNISGTQVDSYISSWKTSQTLKNN